MYYGMQTNGSAWDKPVPQHWTMHYYRDQATRRPDHEYDSQPSAAPVQTMGLGLLGDFMQSPIKAGLNVLRPPVAFSYTRRIDGVGAEEELPVLGTGAALVIFAGIIVIGGILSYQAGKAMAPTTAKEKTWGWIGVPVGLFTGTLGLGIMGIVSNRSK